MSHWLKSLHQYGLILCKNGTNDETIQSLAPRHSTACIDFAHPHQSKTDNFKELDDRERPAQLLNGSTLPLVLKVDAKEGG
jgi:hypothetical protein